MKLTFKVGLLSRTYSTVQKLTSAQDLKQQKFVIEAEPTETIAELKAKVEKEKGWEPSAQKLIYSGKILQDDKTIESYNIQEKGFVVCMTQKSRTVPAASSSSSAAAPSTPAQAPAQTPIAPNAPQTAVPSTTINAPATPSPVPPTATAQDRNFDGMALGSAEREAAIANMEAMGFPRDQIQAAMTAAFYNPDRAVEYLLNGIPENLQRQRPAGTSSRGAAASPLTAPTSETHASPPATAPSGDEPVNLFEAAAQAGQSNRGGGTSGRGTGVAAGTGATAGPGNLDFLRNNPQFQQLRQIVQQQPQMLEPILQQVGAGNPQLAAMIAERPEEFLRLLAEDQGDDDAALPPGAQAIQVTEEEREAIERLCRLGFERDLVIQAYFACDKNEELAANFLFDQPEDDDLGGQ
jgi:UV excision repair protein RAD23